MEDLIRKFLLQSGFPRASLVSDLQSVSSNIPIGSASYLIVDPDTVEKLAVVAVVGPVNAEGLYEKCHKAAFVAKKIGDKRVQAFVIRVDLKAKRDTEQVQFYRCFPNTELEQLNASTFPDLSSLKVHYRLNEPSIVSTPEVLDVAEDSEDKQAEKIGLGAYIPAFLLLLVCLVDLVLTHLLNTQLMKVQHVLLLTGAALLLSMPALVRFFSSSKN